MHGVYFYIHSQKNILQTTSHEESLPMKLLYYLIFFKYLINN